MELEIRPATPDDAAVLRQIVLAAFAEYDGVLEVRPRALSETPEEVEQAIEEGGVLLAWDGDQAVGTVRYELRPDCLYMGRLAVLPSHRRRGVGVALMRYIESLAPTMERSRIELCTRQSMPSNHTFYGRLGYHVARTEPNKRGPDINVWFAKELRPPGLTLDQIKAKLGVDEITDLQQLASVLPAYQPKEQLEPDILTELLWEKVGNALSAALGKKLSRALYRCLKSEWHAREISKPLFFTSGEIELQFEGAPNLFFSWSTDWKIDWDNNYFIEASTESFVLPDNRKVFDASPAPVWKPLVGTALLNVHVLGDIEAPEVLKLTFEGGVVYIGCGYQRDERGDFGDGDDVLVRSEAEYLEKHNFARRRLLTLDSQNKRQFSS